MAEAKKEAASVAAVRDWMREYADKKRPSVKIPDVARMALNHFRKHNSQLVLDLLDKQAYAIFYGMAQQLLAEGRNIHLGNGEVVRDLDEAREAMQARGRSLFDGWTENVGDRNVYLKEMDHTLLIAAGGVRQAQMEAVQAKFRFLVLIREGLPKGKKVGEHYTDAALQTLHDKAYQHNRSKAS